MTEGGPAPVGRGDPGSPARRHRGALAALLLLAGAVIGFTARCGLAALLVNVGNLAVLHGADDLAASAFEAATSVNPATQAASNFRISRALLRGDYNAAADELVGLRALGGSPRGVAATSSVLLHLEAILAERAGDSERALSLIREAVARVGVNAPGPALRLLDQFTREVADQPYGREIVSVRFPVDPRRNTCGDGRRLAQVHLNRNAVAAGGPLLVDLEWTDPNGRTGQTQTRRLRNLAPNGAFTWGISDADLPLGFTAHPDPSPGATAVYVGVADLDGQPLSALVMDNRHGPPRTSRLRSDWIPATPDACYLLASEVWTGGGNPHFGVTPRSPAGALGPVFGLQGPLAQGWRREARLVRLAPDTEALQVFFWNLRASRAVAFSLAIVARLDA